MDNKGKWKIISQYACGCQVRNIEHYTKGTIVSATIIEYCPKHKAAPAMYAALKEIVTAHLADEPGLAGSIVLELGVKALALAEGRTP